jgi:hypothetical protein
MTKEERIKLYAALAAPFPEEAVERTSGAATGRGYDTTGIKYQYLADRLNEVLGVGGFRTERTITIKGTTTAKGRPAFEAIAEVRVELGEWQGGEFVVFAEAWGDGGHTAMSEADARKGSFTNAFKKAVAFMGPGRAAYRGTIDDDHVPEDDVACAVPGPRRGAALATGEGTGGRARRALVPDADGTRRFGPQPPLVQAVRRAALAVAHDRLRRARVQGARAQAVRRGARLPVQGPGEHPDRRAVGRDERSRRAGGRLTCRRRTRTG